MSTNCDTPPKGENSAAVIAAAEERLGERWTAVRVSRLKSIEALQSFGRALIAEKASVPHGEFLALLARVGIEKRTAQDAMKLARLGLKNELVALLGGMRAVLALPPAIVEIIKTDPEAAAELAAIKRQLAEHAFAVAEAQEQTRAQVDRLLASVAKFRRGIEAHRLNKWTPEPDLAAMDTECDEWRTRPGNRSTGSNNAPPTKRQTEGIDHDHLQRRRVQHQAPEPRMCAVHYARWYRHGDTEKRGTWRRWTEDEKTAVAAEKPLSPTAAAYCRYTHGVSKMQLLAADQGRSDFALYKRRKRIITGEST